MMGAIPRRQFCQLIGSSVFASPLLANSSKHSNQRFYSAAASSDDQYWLSTFTLQGGVAKTLLKHKLPGRAHHIAINEESGLFVVVARRPGRYLIVGDAHTGEILQTLEVPQNRHLFGHGVFSKEGDQFYTVESDYQNLDGNNGLVVSWEILVANGEIAFNRQQEFSSQGVGPHELKFMPDNKTLVVANGGIRTHPDSGRKKLNVEAMQPSLVYLNSNNGELVEKKMLASDYQQASIRHLDVNQQGLVVLGLQYEGEPFEDIPLVLTHSLGEAFQTLSIPTQQQQAMKQYVGSVRFDNSGRVIAASCPKGNLITLWDAESHRYIKALRARDGCGVCASKGGFVFTAGTGRISVYDIAADSVTSLDLINEDGKQKIFWDNHLSLI